DRESKAATHSRPCEKREPHQGPPLYPFFGSRSAAPPRAARRSIGCLFFDYFAVPLFAGALFSTFVPRMIAGLYGSGAGACATGCCGAAGFDASRRGAREGARVTGAGAA